MKPAFSTTAFPEWTLPNVLAYARKVGALGVELRTFGHDGRILACEPAQTSAAKLRAMFDDAGVDPACLATSISYDAPIDPPVIGRLFAKAFEKPVAETKLAVNTASAFGCPFVRVFPFELQRNESRKAGLVRIMERLDLALRTARNTGTRLVIENGGSFPRAADIADIINRVSSTNLAAAYNVAVAQAAGDDPVEGFRTLGRSLETVKLTDTFNGTPVTLGDGQLDIQRSVRGLADTGFKGWMVFEYPRLWLRDLPDPEAVVAASIERLYQWAAPAAPLHAAG